MKKKRISKTSAWRNGVSFEYRVKYHFEKLGYYAKRSWGSIGSYDVIAIKPSTPPLSEVLMIQCKNNRKYKPLSRDERKALIEDANKSGAIPIHAYSDEKGHIQFSYLSV